MAMSCAVEQEKLKLRRLLEINIDDERHQKLRYEQEMTAVRDRITQIEAMMHGSLEDMEKAHLKSEHYGLLKRISYLDLEKGHVLELIHEERIELEIKLNRLGEYYFSALGHIIASSYTDDKYGIVQRDLATIVSLLLNLYSESDKYSRLVTSQRIDRRQKSEIDSYLASLRDRLTDTVKKINNAFGNLNDVRLSDQERIVFKRLIDSSVTRN